jgi:hypothetical protein
MELPSPKGPCGRRWHVVPASVTTFFSSANLTLVESVPWFTPPDETKPGVYVVSLAADPATVPVPTSACPTLDLAEIAAWVSKIGDVTLDGRKATPEALAYRLEAWWLPDETIIYIGATDESLCRRVAGYYRTSLGERSPHSGGYWIQALKSHANVFVHLAAPSDPFAAERRLFAAFVAQVSQKSREALPAPLFPFPWANLKYPNGPTKPHGIGGARRKKPR